ncbi:hypothetical protein M153_214000953 [Pseudoloma neurophilia]|uniref:Uncharacterized protein n=1 Tax=Pseudoloma neurophilia TaxID=146866 RepID=A0A0R0LZC5_9MICR|nr:hypothetical protein M153_214000953 [Pseudoloma neurophilia]
MDNKDQKKTYIERITMDRCACKVCDVKDSNGNHKEYPKFSCMITCKKNVRVEQKCVCSESSNCTKRPIGFRSDDSLSLEKLKTFKVGDSENIKNCIDGGDEELKFIYITFENTVKNGTLNAELHVAKDDKKINGDSFFLKPEKLDFPFDIFQNPNDIQIGTEENNQKTSNMQNKNLVTQKTQTEMDLNQNFENITKIQNDQITEKSIGNGLVATAIIGSLFFVSALFIGLGFLYKKYRNKTTETNPEDSNNVI